MNNKKKYDAEEAVPVAREIIERLEPFCERIEIAGSLRRCQLEVGDIEILFIPRFEDRQKDLFHAEPMDVTAEAIEWLVSKNYLSRRLKVNGSPTWGAWNKLTRHVASDIPVDLFATTAENWWTSLVIRTGSKQTNLKLATGAKKLGRSLNAYDCGVTESDGRIIPATSEAHLFELCGVPFKEPNAR